MSHYVDQLSEIFFVESDVFLRNRESRKGFRKSNSSKNSKKCLLIPLRENEIIEKRIISLGGFIWILIGSPMRFKKYFLRLKKWEKEVELIKQKKALYDLELDSKATFADYPLSAQERTLTRPWTVQTKTLAQSGDVRFGTVFRTSPFFWRLRSVVGLAMVQKVLDRLVGNFFPTWSFPTQRSFQLSFPTTRQPFTKLYGSILCKTLRGIRRYLPESENASPTAIQRATLLTALRGKDILAAAKTGSGKTLAFLIPLLEKLWTERWTNQDSTAAVVLSPTRELAMQTYDVLRTIAIRHDFSASLIIGGQTGGKNFKEEAGAIGRMNIIIATPGIFSKNFIWSKIWPLRNSLL